MVESMSLRCSNAGQGGCKYVTVSKKAQQGDECPRCRSEGREGVLERLPHPVDLSAYRGNGKCDCDSFRCKMEPALKLLPCTGPIRLRIRCKHIDAALAQAKSSEEDFTALLLALPNQEEQV